MLKKDYYGNEMYFFVGVIKDVNDPLNSNRVKVRIKGIHPDDPEGDGFKDEGTTGTSTGTNGSSSYSTGGSFGGGAPNAPLGPVKPLDNLPSATQSTGKVSQNFTLGHFINHPSFGGARGIAYLNANPQYIKNISNLALNALDPLYEKFKFRITSGIRTPGSSSENVSNHGYGYAADIQMAGGSTQGLREMYNYINVNLRGRFTMCLLEMSKHHVHVQLGGKGSLESPIVKQIN